ncbi:M20/M25/M40 family metallo-hydrolase, partial [Bradyrhizobium algeriense]|uniref:M20/M25/M40 family metallo-hydrolase n=1 Tax=Bradyrhizobium algeriense TaxID=634784 RepID=UPI001FCEB5CD
MSTPSNPYRGFRYPPEIINQAVWLYHCFSLSLREVELILAARGIVVSYETIREWGQRFRSGEKRLGIRADMDALPIQEATGLSYASTHEEIMHACGHDGHTAILLAAAKALADDVDFSGELHLIFQPAEEIGAGARRMITEGLFERFPCDAVF